MGQDAIHGLTAAYALHALTDEEEAEYEAHLARCPDCRDELASFRETAAALAYGIEAPAPSPALRDRILAQARSERSNVVPLPRRRWALPTPRWAFPTPRWALPAAAAAAAAAVVVAIGVGLWAASLSSSLDEERQAREQQDAALVIVGDPEARRFPLSGADGTLVVASDGEAALVLRDLEAAPEGKVYEAWVSSDGKTMLAAGTFRAESGATVVPLARPVPASGLVAVTLEDRPVAAPTSEPLFTARAA